MRHGSLFSGIGGFDLAAEWMGWHNVFHCEWNEFGRKILNYYWPNSTSYGNIKETDFNIYRGRIDVLTGGFPCQPYSTAGKRLGKEDDRHLWPEMLRAIKEIQPRFIVGENVSGIISWNGGLVFNEVQTDLEAEGYNVQPILLPACGVNAPHRRDRVWFVAKNTNKNGRTGNVWKKESKIRRFRDAGTGNNEPIPPYNNETRTFTNTNSQRGRSRDDKREYAADVDSQREAFGYGGNFEGWPTVPPLCFRDDGLSNRLDGITFPKFRRLSIEAAGNAIVPQVAYEIFKAIDQTETNGR